MESEREARPALTVAMIDDDDVVHAGIEAWCAHATPPIKLVGNFRHPREFFARYPDGPDEDDVVLFGLQSGGGRPDFTTLRQLCESGQRVIIYSHLDADEVILTSLELGAVTYLVMSEGRGHLIEAIRAADSARPYLGPRMAKALLNDRTSGRTKLSEREKEVLRVWFQTESKELVAKRLNIASTTVSTHLQRARAKYAAVGRPAPTKSTLLARAVEDGILSLNEL